MIILNLIQGTEEWKQARRVFLPASKAPAMMGASQNTTRTELLDEMKTGIEKEYGSYLQEVVFQQGHDIEEAVRPIVEQTVFDGEELLRPVATDDKGLYSASYDGIVTDDSRVWECKQWSWEKADYIHQHNEVPPCDYWQVVQQVMIAEADECVYTLAANPDESSIEMLHVTYKRDMEAEKKLRAGWDRFLADLETHEPTIKTVKPVAEAVTSLPMLDVQIKGELSTSNAADFRSQVQEMLAGINKELITDQDFANAEAQVKALKKGESQISDVLDNALSGEVKITIDNLKETQALMRESRLYLDKAVKTEKQNRKTEMVQAAKSELESYIQSLRDQQDDLPLQVEYDFGAVIKGKSSLEKIQDAINTHLANCKIQAELISNRIRENLTFLHSTAESSTHLALFHDLKDVIGKQKDDFAALVKSRILEHEAEQQRRIEAEKEKARQEEEARQQRLREQEATRIREEEQKKAMMEREKVLAEERHRQQEERKRMREKHEQIKPDDAEGITQEIERSGEPSVRTLESQSKAESAHEEIMADMQDNKQESGLVSTINRELSDAHHAVQDDEELSKALLEISQAAAENDGFRQSVLTLANAARFILSECEDVAI